MFEKNSLRFRKGQRSSRGLDTIDPSERTWEETRGATIWSGSVITSQITGQGIRSTARISSRKAE